VWPADLLTVLSIVQRHGHAIICSFGVTVHDAGMPTHGKGQKGGEGMITSALTGFFT
jgi:hypothetical protein